jgi:hypothetical protein
MFIGMRQELEGAKRGPNETFGEVCRRRLRRRVLLKGVLAGAPPLVLAPSTLGQFDLHGHLWIATDGQPSTFKKKDGVYAVPAEGPERGYVRQFLSGVPGGEVASLIFSPNNHALFCSVQHPAEGSTIDNLSSTWPDDTTPPRPSVIVVEKTGVGSRVIGS